MTQTTRDGCRPGTNQPFRFRTSLRNTILDVLRSRGWKETDSETDWDFHWADVGWIREVLDHIRLDEHQRVNHFRNHYELTRKDFTVKNLKRMKKTLEKEEKYDEASKFDFFPATYSLPADYGLFEVDFKRNPNAVWIMKPPAKAQGKGIFLFTKISQISEWRKEFKWRTEGRDIKELRDQAAAAAAKENNNAGTDGKVASGAQGKDPNAAPEAYLAQRYIDNPHLVGGKKYDLRIYCLVNSWAPLQAWLYRSGFARFCHSRFNLKDIENTFIHVTNVAVQKTNPKYTSQSGCKWGIRMLKQYLNSTVGEKATNKVFGEIQWLILRSLQAVQKIMMHDKHCFELYGYDILIDDTLRPWLVECNASPSLTAETPADYHLKFNLLDDMLSVIDMEKKLKGTEERIGGFDLIWKNGQPAGIALADSARAVTTYLGADNELAIPMSKLKLPPRMTGQNSSERPLI